MEQYVIKIRGTAFKKTHKNMRNGAQIMHSYHVKIIKSNAKNL